MARVGNSGDPSHLGEREMQDARQQLRRTTPPPENPVDTEAAAAFEEAYLRYAPRLQRIAIRKFRIEAGDAEVLVQDVFTTYFQHAAQVELLEPYLIGAICNASRTGNAPATSRSANVGPSTSSSTSPSTSSLSTRA